MSFLATTAPRLGLRSIALTNQALVVCASLVLFLPSAVFAAGLRTVPGLAVLAGCCGALALIARRPTNDRDGLLAARLDLPKLIGCLAIAVAILLLGGETHLFYATSDWLIRDAVLSDLVNHGFPLAYQIDGSDYILRAPLGMYLVPALVGGAIGLKAAHIALLLQNAALLAAILYLLMSMGRGWAHLLIMLLFAGVSIVGGLIQVVQHNQGNPPFWLRWGLDAWHPLFQYSGTLVQFFWVPNHALPGWWLATLLLLQGRRQVDTGILGVSVAGALLWSPLSLIPVVPWLLYSSACRSRETFADKRTWVGAGLATCFLPILVYLVSGSGTIDGGSPLENEDFWFLYVLFVAVQLPVLGYLARAWHDLARGDRALLVINSLTLLVLPFFRFGPHNDLVMRASIASLTVVAFCFGDVLLATTSDWTRRVVFGWVLVAVSSFSAFVEVGRAVTMPPYAISTCTMMEASHAVGNTGLPTNYVVAAMPDWLIDAKTAPKPALAERACWPDKQPLPKAPYL